jgi:hypothetical protein
MKKSGTCKIEDTVAALEEAIESRKKQMYMVQVQSAYSGPNVASHVFSELINRAGGVYGPISQVLENGRGFVQDFIKKAQQNVEENPWDALRKVAAFSFGIGLFLSRRHHKSPMGEKE